MYNKLISGDLLFLTENYEKYLYKKNSKLINNLFYTNKLAKLEKIIDWNSEDGIRIKEARIKSGLWNDLPIEESRYIISIYHHDLIGTKGQKGVIERGISIFKNDPHTKKRLFIKVPQWIKNELLDYDISNCKTLKNKKTLIFLTHKCEEYIHQNYKELRNIRFVNCISQCSFNMKNSKVSLLVFDYTSKITKKIIVDINNFQDNFFRIIPEWVINQIKKPSLNFRIINNNTNNSQSLMFNKISDILNQLQSESINVDNIIIKAVSKKLK